jgi:hypothetical protein
MCILKDCDKPTYELGFCQEHWDHYSQCFKEYLAAHGILSIEPQIVTIMPPSTRFQPKGKMRISKRNMHLKPRPEPMPPEPPKPALSTQELKAKWLAMKGKGK